MNSSFEAGQNSPRTREWTPGMVILNTYEIRGLLGRGGMGAVYRVYHRYLQKEMAMKTLLVDRVTNSSWLRFQAEAKAIAKLEHPNIIQIFDMGVCESGQPFYTMELLKGQGLDEWIRRNPITITQALFVFRQVATGLAFAHERGIIHRDIKPANMVLTFVQADSPPVVKVVDFGLAKLATDDQGLTKEGEVFGSPLYMSPEQASGLRVDHRSDIYSFGCALYETLTGFPPFKGKSAMETMLMHLDKTAVPIERARAEVNYPPGLSAVVLKCLAKVPDVRYRDASQLANDLLKIEQGRGAEVTAHLERELAQAPTTQLGPGAQGAGRLMAGRVLENRHGEIEHKAVLSEDESEEDYVSEDGDEYSDELEQRSPHRKWPQLLACLVGLVLVAGIFWAGYSYVNKVSAKPQPAKPQPTKVQPTPEERELASCRRLSRSLDHFKLTAKDLPQLELREPLKKRHVYFLFPEDGQQSLGCLHIQSTSTTRAASGLVVLPLKDSCLWLFVSPQLAEKPDLLKGFGPHDIYALTLPINQPPANERRVASVCDDKPEMTVKLLHSLKRFEFLGYLDTAYAQLDNQCLRALEALDHLTSLELTESILAPGTSFKELKNLDGLITLSLPHGVDPSFVFKRLNGRSKLQNLRIDEMDAAFSPGVMHSANNLEVFTSRHSELTGDVIAKLATFPKLRTLDFNGSRVAKEARPILQGMKNLKNLTLSKDIAMQWGAKEFADFQKARGDITLNLEGERRGRAFGAVTRRKAAREGEFGF